MRMAIVVHDHLGGVGEVLQLDKMATFLEARLFGVLAGPGLILSNAVGPGFLQEEAPWSCPLPKSADKIQT